MAALNKAFTLRLQTITAAGLFLTGALLSCRHTPPAKHAGHPLLQGSWQQQQPATPAMPLSNTTLAITFRADSFYMHLYTVSKVNYYTPECYNKGHWHEYVKGQYLLRKDSLLLLGTYTHPNFKQKLTGCYHIGIYRQTFLFKALKGQPLQLTSLNPQISYSLLSTSHSVAP